MNKHDPDAGAFRAGDPPLTAGATASGPTCKMCTKGTITRTRVYRMNKVGVAVGYLLFVLPALWVVLLIAHLLNPPPARNLNEFERAAESIQRGLAEGFLVCFAIVGLVGALLGWLLVLK